MERKTIGFESIVQASTSKEADNWTTFDSSFFSSSFHYFTPRKLGNSPKLLAYSFKLARDWAKKQRQTSLGLERIPATGIYYTSSGV